MTKFKFPSFRRISGEKTYEGRSFTIPSGTKEDIRAIKSLKTYESYQHLFCKAIKTSNMFQLEALSEGAEKKDSSFFGLAWRLSEGLSVLHATDFADEAIDYLLARRKKLFLGWFCWNKLYGEGNDYMDEAIVSQFKDKDFWILKSIENDNERAFHHAAGALLEHGGLESFARAAQCAVESEKIKYIDLIKQYVPNILELELDKLMPCLSNEYVDLCVDKGMDIHKAAQYLNPEQLKHCIAKYDITEDVLAHGDIFLEAAIVARDSELIKLLCDTGIDRLRIIDTLTAMSIKSSNDDNENDEDEEPDDQENDVEKTNEFSKALKSLFMESSKRKYKAEWSLDNESVLIKKIFGNQTTRTSIYDFQERVVIKTIEWIGRSEASSTAVIEMDDYKADLDLSTAEDMFIELGGDQGLLNTKKTVPVLSLNSKRKSGLK